ncbi:dihydroxyacetone kinase [Streptomyces alkaliphilus]|uniref:Dihydroxyacetone kinase n=1 Tax=Streptomyces alkaliphilus TaxID=1472722 RepID=A0A7W3Y076_9ACTN|nr:dihydroxyacetone kinase subunit DhaK [Streptomyces alkaliphilus]MBB0243309.1 dihydroxyacetone kinase [Streptomyces alkaliphilus]
MVAYFATEPESLLADALNGFCRVHADLVVRDAGGGYLRARHPSPGRRVGLVSGGGSGHEPLHIGFVGAGMLDAACPGRVFTSPHNRQILEASRAVAGPEGVLHIVKNYTGDRINFGIAAERLAHLGIPCARVLVDDDLATATDGPGPGRRGTAATVLVEKVLGAAADRGADLPELLRLGERVTARCRSLAVASRSHALPATGDPAFELARNEVEFGVGIHGERAERAIPREPLTRLLERMTDPLLAALAPAREEPVILLVNGLGAVTELELYAIHDAVERLLHKRGVTSARCAVGEFVTTLDMRGFSLTLMVTDRETLELYDAPVHTPVWRW